MERLYIQFTFSDERRINGQRINYAQMPYTRFNDNNICQGNGKSHDENKIIYDIEPYYEKNIYYGKIVEIMYNNCIFYKYIPHESDGAIPIKAVLF